MKGNPGIKVVIEDSGRQDEAFLEFCDFINNLAKRYRLNFYECWGILEAMRYELFKSHERNE